MKRYDPLTEEVGGYGQTDARIAIKSEVGADGQVGLACVMEVG